MNNPVIPTLSEESVRLFCKYLWDSSLHFTPSRLQQGGSGTAFVA